jgi:hypothetical protein
MLDEKGWLSAARGGSCCKVVLRGEEAAVGRAFLEHSEAVRQLIEAGLKRKRG